MKTLHLTNSWHRTSGGIATFYRALIEQANQRGHEIRLVVPGEKDEIEDCGEFGRIYYLQSPRALFNHGYRLIYPSQYLFARGQLQQILISERPDLIEICDKYTLNYLGALLRTRLLPDVDFRPMVVGLSCERMDDNFRSYIGTLPFDGTFCAAYMRWLYFPFFDYHIANSEYTAAELRSAAQGHLVPRGTWIRHMGVNLQRFSPARRSRALRQRLLQNFGAPEASVLLLYVGRLVPEKNLPLLFDLLAHLAHNGRSDFRLLVVGDGIERAKWDADAGQRAPGRALFFGHIKDQNILADLYANADLFVHPNPHEPFGIAPLEAMASGLPLIAPDSGGITSYANSGNAWTVAAPTVEQFSAAVHDALSSEELRAAKTRAALRTAGQYEWTSVASSFLDLYTKMQRASRNAAEALPAPAFTSSTASRLRSTLLRGVAASVASTFKLFSNLRSDSRAGSMQRPAPVCDWKAGRRAEP